MSRIAASPLYADSPERQGYVIDYDQYILNRDVLLVFPVSYGVTAEIHVGRRFEKDNLFVLNPALAYVAIACGGKRNIGCLGKGIQYSESYIMAGALVF